LTFSGRGTPPDALVVLPHLGEDLESDLPIEGGIARQVDLAHATGAQRADHVVVRNEVVGLKGFGHRCLPALV
jgi:hypothetical protein